jgi:2-polyprenyl-3-methyl-5-hydroxy-6-metoxy-1,4-benzoquinol methylase
MTMQSNIIEKMYFYESFAEDFDSRMNMYDTNKRLFVVYNELLTEDISNKKVLDAGCGTGWFSKAAADRGAIVTSMDLGENLLSKVAMKCNSERIVGSILEIPFPDNFFDIVISSEVIEHVPDPFKAMHELYRVLKPGGNLILTTPNKIWYFAVWIGNTFKMRPYQGLENWTGWFEMKRKLNRIGIKEYQLTGIHLFPFVSSLFYPVLDFFHRFNSVLGPVMLNIAVKAKKPF